MFDTSNNTSSSSTTQPTQSVAIDKIELVHHGVAASSQPKTMCWMSDHSFIYSSQGILNIAHDVAANRFMNFGNDNEDNVLLNHHHQLQNQEKEITKNRHRDSQYRNHTLLMHVNQTLRSSNINSIAKEETRTTTSSQPESFQNDSTTRPIITAVSEIVPVYPAKEGTDTPFQIVASTLSDGTIHIWIKVSTRDLTSEAPRQQNQWKEYILLIPPEASSTQTSTATKESSPINCIHGKYMLQYHSNPNSNISSSNNHAKDQHDNKDEIHAVDHHRHHHQWSIVLLLFIASANGINLILVPLILYPSNFYIMTTVSSSSTTTTSNHPTIIPSSSTFHFHLGSYMTASVITQTLMSFDSSSSSLSWDPKLLLISGTASPKGNRIHIHSISLVHSFLQYFLIQKDWTTTSSHVDKELYPSFIQTGIMYHGSLIGHLDWISCFDFGTIASSQSNKLNNDLDFILASGSHDQRIRLWRFHMPTSSTTINTTATSTPSSISLEEDLSNLHLITHANEKDDIHLTLYKEDEQGMDDDDDDDKNPIEDLDEGEARLYIPLTKTPTMPDNMNSSTSLKAAVVPITLEAVLMGHEGRVTSVSWRPRKVLSSPPCLLSSSIDRSILIWMEETGTTNGDSLESNMGTHPEGIGVWVPISRVGAAGGIIGGSIGSSLLGYVDAIFSPCSNFIVGHAYGGSLHFWVSSERFEEEESTVVYEEDENHGISRVERWTAAPSITGHFRGVADISWEATRGSYLLSVSSDQTCRLWSCIWNEQTLELWRELARPQVHGYDLNTVACIGDGNTEPLHRFVSGADEKEIRAFDAPLASLRILNLVQGDQIIDKEEDHFEERVERAFVPALGLSNRYNIDDAMDENDGSGNGGDGKGMLQPSGNLTSHSEYPRTAQFNEIVNALPFERDLGVISVWPEFRKLFGHQSEVICLASRRNASPLGGILASSSKARDTENAAIRLWDVTRGECIDTLRGHKSTVVSLSFSSDGLYLASAGKDRRLCLWRMATEGSNSFLSSAVDIAHKRIIWSIHFCPTEPKILASGSRDGTVKIWIVLETSDNTKLIEKVKFEPSCKAGKKVEPVTAVAFAPKAIMHDDGARQLLLAVGAETGLIEIWSVGIGKGISDSSQSIQISLLQSLPMNFWHFGSVNRLLWKPYNTAEENGNSSQSKLTLASCSSDHGVRIFNLYVYGIQ